jgi:uncharacterized protein
VSRSVTITLSASEARRLAVASQGFGARPTRATVAHVRRLAGRLGAFQIDSVNVLTRAHYMPAFARLGAYPATTLDSLAYEQRELFEYWGHAACLLPTSLYPIVRYRMNHHVETTTTLMRSPRGAYLARVYAEIGERGPLTAAELSDAGTRSGKWWNWSKGKAAVEHLYDAGLVAVAGRRRFERLYDVTERVVPQAVLDAPVPSREDAMKQLLCHGARAYGIGTLKDIVRYFEVDGWRDRLPPGPHWLRPKGPRGRRRKAVVRQLVLELVEEGRLVPVRVEGWNEQAFMYPKARVPEAVHARAFVTPFDSLVWDRARVQRLFGMDYVLEMYVPESRRVFGYYTCPFLLGDTLAARSDLKADRDRRTLVVQSAFLERGQDSRSVLVNFVHELRALQAWLGLDHIELAERGDLLATLRRNARGFGLEKARGD